MYIKLLICCVLLFCSSSSIFAQTKTESLLNKFNSTNDKDLRYQILDSITVNMFELNHPKTKKYLKKFILLANQKKDYDRLAKKSINLARIYNNKGDIDSAFTILNVQIKKGLIFKNKSNLGQLYLERSYSYSLINERVKAFNDIEKSIKLFEIAKDSFFLAHAICTKAKHYSYYGDLIKAINQYHKAYELLKKNDYRGLYRVSNGIAELYSKIGLEQKSIEEQQKAYKYALKMGDQMMAADAHLGIADGYFRIGNYEMQKKYTDSAKVRFDKDPDSVAWKKFYVHTNYANYYLKKNNLKLVKFHIEKSDFFLNKSHAYDFFKIFSLNIKGEYYLKTNEFKKSLTSFKELLKEGNKMGFREEAVEAHNGISKIYEKLHKFDKALYHKKMYDSIIHKINKDKNAKILLYYQSVFEAKEKEKTILNQKIKIKNLEFQELLAQKKQQIIYTIVSILILLTILFAYRKISKIKKRKKSLELMLIQSELELQKFTKIILERSIEKESLEKEVNKLKDQFGKIEAIEKLEDLAASKILTEDDWIKFKQKFNDAYPLFFKTIEKNGFKLSKGEKRLVALEKLNLDTNQISNILGISTDSIRTVRYRLRKKINAPSDIDIVTYLLN